MKTVDLNLLDSDSIDNAIKELNNYLEWIEKTIPVFISKLADRGIEVANIKFAEAEYDGTPDYSVSIQKNSDKDTAVMAIGRTVLFMEFGTGISYPADHPDPVASSFPHGGYGHHLGNFTQWRYPGFDPGTNGVIDTEHPGYIITHGNRANACMYNTVKELKAAFEDVAKEVFEYD